MSVVVVDYGAGNTRSVLAALAHLGAGGVVTSDTHAIGSADLVILPGVGSARSAMVHLRATGASGALVDRVREGGATLGICLGLQLALARSAEDGGVEGLGLAPGEVVRLTSERVPRLGWCVVEPWDDTYYFAHSYVARSDAAVAWAEGEVAAVRAGSFLGVQFHPEKSGPAGLAFLERCL
ncbi:MAG: imidazole glycerol phosphate synthase subunit HisH [Acidimicrobiales bacterium]